MGDVSSATVRAMWAIRAGNRITSVWAGTRMKRQHHQPQSRMSSKGSRDAQGIPKPRRLLCSGHRGIRVQPCTRITSPSHVPALGHPRRSSVRRRRRRASRCSETLILKLRVLHMSNTPPGLARVSRLPRLVRVSRVPHMSNTPPGAPRRGCASALEQRISSSAARLEPHERS